MNNTVALILSLAFLPGLFIYDSLKESKGFIEKLRTLLMWVGIMSLGTLLWAPSFMLLGIGVVALLVVNTLPSSDPRLNR
jgi:hypothetical protein